MNNIQHQSCGIIPFELHQVPKDILKASNLKVSDKHPLGKILESLLWLNLLNGNQMRV